MDESGNIAECAEISSLVTAVITDTDVQMPPWCSGWSRALLWSIPHCRWLLDLLTTGASLKGILQKHRRITYYLCFRALLHLSVTRQAQRSLIFSVPVSTNKSPQSNAAPCAFSSPSFYIPHMRLFIPTLWLMPLILLVKQGRRLLH